MKLPLAVIALFVTGLFCSSPLLAQEHAEAGVFADYLRVTDLGHFWGLGGRVGVGLGTPYAQIEAEMSYNFEQSFTEGFTNPSTGAVFFSRSPISIFDGLIGPEIHTAGGAPGIAFFTIKGGFINFRTNNEPATFGTFFGSFDTLRNTWHGALYPAGGLKTYVGPVGVRLEIGDEIYWIHGAHNNLRITFGPTIRF